MLKNLFKRAAPADHLQRAEQLVRQGNEHEDAGRLAEAIGLYQEAVALAPAWHKSHLNLGIGLAAQGETARATAAFQAGLELAPTDPFLNFNYARLLYTQHDFARAGDHAQRAVDAKKDFASAYVLLSNVRDDLGEYDAALEAIDAAMAIPPPSAGMHLNRMRLLLQQLRVAEAIDGATAALAMWPGDAELHWNLAIAHLMLGQFDAGWREHEWRSRVDSLPTLPDFGLPRWDSRRHPRGRSILVFAEQGLGDSLQFMRYVPMVAERFEQVALMVPPALCELARANVPPNCVVIGDGPAPPPCEFQCPLLSLPLALAAETDPLPGSVPYLAADPQRVEAWRTRLAGLDRRLNVGLVWSGNPAHGNDRNRSIPLQALRRLAAPGCRFISLQPEVRESDREAMEDWPEFERWGEELRDFRDTAALVTALDLVITVDTSVAHLAGALGRPLWVLLPYCPDWRWLLGRDDSPWYPTARLYRQPRPGDWASVLSRVAADLGRVPAPRAEHETAQDWYLRGRAKRAASDWDDAEAAYRKALAMQPDFALALRDLAEAVGQSGRAADALQMLETAIDSLADDPVAWHLRGNLHFALRQFEAAAQSYARAADLRPGFVEALSNRAVCLQKLGHREEAVRLFNEVLQLRPDYRSALYNLGVVLLDLGRCEEVLQLCDEALRFHPQDADIHWNKAIAHLTLGQYAEGWPEHEWRWNVRVFGEPIAKPSFKCPVWTGKEPVRGKSILLYPEQGLGDTVQFMRYGPLLAQRGARVSMQLPPALEPLVEDWQGITLIREGDPLPRHDYYCTFLSLPMAFGTRLDSVPADVPYLRSDPALRAQWEAELGPRQGPRIGLVWSGNPQMQNDANRSMPLTVPASLIAQLPAGIQWVSLQKEIRESDRATLAACPSLRHYGERLRTFAESAALADCMDLVVSSDTSMAHLAGALGKPLWMLLSFRADWRWLLGRADNPWYPTARLFRQDERRDWAPVIARVRDAIRQEVLAPAGSAA